MQARVQLTLTAARAVSGTGRRGWIGGGCRSRQGAALFRCRRRPLPGCTAAACPRSGAGCSGPWGSRRSSGKILILERGGAAGPRHGGPDPRADRLLTRPPGDAPRHRPAWAATRRPAAGRRPGGGAGQQAQRVAAVDLAPGAVVEGARGP